MDREEILEMMREAPWRTWTYEELYSVGDTAYSNVYKKILALERWKFVKIHNVRAFDIDRKGIFRLAIISLRIEDSHAYGSNQSNKLIHKCLNKEGK